MFCYKCGTELPEESEFCYKCGANQTAPEKAQPTVNIPKAETVQSVSADINSFKNFVDNHVRTTTKFSSAEDLLKNGKPSPYVGICFGIPALIGFLIGFVPSGFVGGLLVALLFSALFGYLAAFFASSIIYIKHNSKFSGKFRGAINVEDLIVFLNENLKYIHPDFHEWSCEVPQQRLGFGLRGRLLTATVESAKKSLKGFSLCATFGPKQKQLLLLSVNPDVQNRDSGEMLYSFGATNNGTVYNSTFSRNTWLFKTAPILQAAMEYYLKLNNKK